jgi:hypothetical protein
MNVPAVILHHTTCRRIAEDSSFIVTTVTSSDVTCTVLILSVNIVGSVSFGFPIKLPVYTFIYYRVFLLSPCRARRLRRIERLHLPEHSVTAKMLVTTINETHFVLTAVYEKFALISVEDFLYAGW